MKRVDVLALGATRATIVAAGSCRHTFCGKMDTCQAMEGKKCRFSLVARPSMEAVGIDVYQMVAGPAGTFIPSAALPIRG